MRCVWHLPEYLEVLKSCQQRTHVVSSPGLCHQNFPASPAVYSHTLGATERIYTGTAIVQGSSRVGLLSTTLWRTDTCF